MATDDDGRIEANGSVTATITSGAYQIGDAASATVAVFDNDMRGVTVTPTALTIREGSSANYIVGLDTEPTADVTVAVQVPEGAEISAVPTALTFTVANWRMKQLVEVTAAQDDDAVADNPVTIRHAVSGGDYGAVTAPSVTVTILEDDPAIRIADPAAVEEGGTVTFTLTRIGDLTVPLTVPVDVTERGAFLADGIPTEATFDVDAETATLLVATDDDERDEADGAVTATITDGAIHRVGDAASATVPVANNDERGVTVIPMSLTVDEGSSASYTVVLNTEPTADVIVEIQVPDNSDITVGQAALTFTTDNWNTPQTVAVTAAHDDDDDDDPVVLTHTVSGGDYDTVIAADIEVTITEDDTPALIIADANATESDEEITFTVRLNVASSKTVTVDWTTADGTATQGADYAETTGTLRFDALETEQTITVPLLDDALDENDETFTIALSNPSNAMVADDTATGTITDDDPSVEKAWLARFGRTTASQVMDAVSDRLTGRSGGDAHLTVGGQRVTLAAMSGQGSTNAVVRTVPAENASLSDVLSQHPFYHPKRSSFADIRSRSSFQVSSAATDEERDVRWTAWGRGATTRFRSEEVDLSLTGSPVTALLGVELATGRSAAGNGATAASASGQRL